MRANRLPAIYFLLCIFIATAYSDDISFQRFGPEAGLSQSTVNALLQDRYGFIWVATEGGLNRFDGYGFRVFRSDPTDSTSLCNNDIGCLLEDDAGLIWVGTRDGISVFDPEQEQFYSFFSDPLDSSSLNNSSVLTIYQTSNGDILVGTPQGLNKLIKSGPDYSEWAFYRYPRQTNPDRNHLSPGIVRSICEDKQGRIWIAVSSRVRETQEEIGALALHDKDLSMFSHFYHDSTEQNSLSSNSVSTVFCDDSNTLWVGTIDKGLNKIQLAEDGSIANYRRFLHDPGNPMSLPHNYVMNANQDRDGTLWVATYDGVAKYQPQTATFQVFQYDPDDDHSIPAPSAFDLFADAANNLWIGTENGLCLSTPSTKAFKSYTSSAGEESLLAGGDIFGIVEDRDGEVWLSSYAAGISRIIPQDDGSEKSVIYSPTATGTNRIPTNWVLGLVEDSARNVWVASFNGLLKIQKQPGVEQIALEHFKRDANSVSITSDFNRWIYQREKNKLWAQTFQDGFDEIEFDGKITNITNHKFVVIANDTFTVLPSSSIDNYNTIWVSTEQTLFLAEPDSGQNLKYVPVQIQDLAWESLQKQRIHTYYRSEADVLWIGTNNGLFEIVFENSVEPADDTLWASATRYTVNDGLPDNAIYAIESDSHQNLWLSTNKGLTRFSLVEKTSRNFDVTDGLPGNEFNARAVEKGKNGHLYFGGINGFVKFHPDSIQDNQFTPPVRLTAFKIMNEPVAIDPSDGSRLRSSILTTDGIQIRPTDYVFSIEFAALNYNRPERNSYAYKLEGFHDEWIYLGYQRSVTFTNLDPGQYNLTIKASNNDGIWNEHGTSLKITVLPPLWRTNTAYILYFILLAGMIWGIVALRARKIARETQVMLRIEEAKVEERERVRKKTSQDFHDEAGARLTKITLLTELVSRNLTNNVELQEHLQRIRENTRELSMGMRDFLWILDAGKDSLFDTIKRIEEFGNSMFEYSDIQFAVTGVNSAFKQIQLSMETRRAIMLIFKEGINNALKYSKARNAFLSVEQSNTQVSITLIDNGTGFNVDELSKGYGLNNMKTRAESIGGELEVKSNPGDGTSIYFRYYIDVV